ncbi:MAG: winged helix-turn-helix transcriptional regulator [Actinomycetota bacterium]|nr:winged helix-turn-helix transcriptional regulator [Actinomycetota bacterium]
MTRYAQYCALARATEIVGNRWTLLIVRELRPGPRRFTDLLEGLPGISRKLLSERLRELERDGIVARRELPPPIARQVYELTDDGRDLAAAAAPLMAWGVRRLGERRPGEFLSPRASSVAMVGLADRDASRGVRETYQYIVGEQAFYFIVDDGWIEVRDGRAEDPAVVVTTDEDTWADLASGKTKTSSAIATGSLTVAGDAQAYERLRKIFSRRHMLGRVNAQSVRPSTRMSR